MENLRLDPDWIGLWGSRDGDFEAVDPFLGNKQQGQNVNKGRDGGARHRFSLRLAAGCGTWPI